MYLKSTSCKTATKTSSSTRPILLEEQEQDLHPLFIYNRPHKLRVQTVRFSYNKIFRLQNQAPEALKMQHWGYYTELFGMATFKMLSLFSPHCTSEHLKQNEASRSFFSSLLLPNFTKRNKSESYFSISKISSSSRVAPSIIKAILYFLMNIIRRCNC